MAMKIEDYALLGDTHTAALVSREGSVDWMCLPRFDSGACFAALLGSAEHGRWQIRPQADPSSIVRRYRVDTLVLETDFQTPDGSLRIVDFMAVDSEYPTLVRIIEGRTGSVPVQFELVVRFDYGSILPWVRTIDGRLVAVAGPDAVVLQSPISIRGEGLKSVAEFTVHAGQSIAFAFTWYPSHEREPDRIDTSRSLEKACSYWQTFARRCGDQGKYRDDIIRSLITLKALTYAPTGGIVAAATTSLPEAMGGVRNWDYRYCWLRDSTFTLYALLHGGHVEEASAFRDWLLRAVAGDPAKLQIMYGLAGERRLEERILDWLPGYESSRPVRVGNAAAGQLQLDVYGEVSDTLHQARRFGIDSDGPTWAFQSAITEWLETAWSQPDEGLWETRGGRRQFTHSKVMTWVALDRAVKAIEMYGHQGPLERWRHVRDEIRRSVCTHGFDATQNSFTQAYGSPDLDASLLLIPAVGFLPVTDPRVKGTIAAIERGLMSDGFVRRYVTHDQKNPDGLPGTEAAFLACSFWLVDAYALAGRKEEAERLFQHLLSVRNDVGLLSEQYDPRLGRLTGNFPQAFSHVALVNSARNLTEPEGPAAHRRDT
jgi:GH15 family glucan-1,4-alpha-glucosidase